MADQERPDRTESDGRLILLYGLLFTVGLVLFVVGLFVTARTGDPTLAGLGVIGLLVPAALYPIASALPAASRATSDHQPWDRLEEQLRHVQDDLELTDPVKRIVFLDRQRQALLDAVRRPLEREDFDSAESLANEAAGVLGETPEVSSLRQQVAAARSRRMENAATEANARLDVLLERYEWEPAEAEIKRFEASFPALPQTAAMHQRIAEARNPEP